MVNEKIWGGPAKTPADSAISDHAIHIQPQTSQLPLTAPSTLPSTPIAPTMFLQRSAFAVARRAATGTIAKRTFASSFVVRE
jgi:hypothetical protein